MADQMGTWVEIGTLTTSEIFLFLLPTHFLNKKCVRMP